MTGDFILWIRSRNFGFIIADGVKYYCHVSDIKSGTPAYGKTAHFDIDPEREGPCPQVLNVAVEEASPKEGVL